MDKDKIKPLKKLSNFHVCKVGKLKIETHKGIKEQVNSKAKFLTQMPGINNGKSYFFLLVAFQNQRKEHQKIFLGKKQSQSWRNIEGKLISRH